MLPLHLSCGSQSGTEALPMREEPAGEREEVAMMEAGLSISS